MNILALILIAFGMDLLIGDPRSCSVMHPVRLIGTAIRALERALRKTRLPLRLAGVLLTAGVVVGTVAAVSLLRVLPAVVRDIATALLLYYALASHALAKESLDVLRGATQDEMRKRLSFIVSRDTAEMSEHKIRTSLIETISENSVDGVYAPLFWMFVGAWFGCSVELVWMYKAASTLDSMVGYRNEAYREIGCCSARLDDVLNFLPARLSMPFVWLAGVALSAAGFPLHPRNALGVFWRDRYRHESPNSAFPMSMFAGLLGVRLGGPTSYGGVVKDKPYIGDEMPGVDYRRSIYLAVALMLLTAVLIVIAGAAILWAR